MKQIIFTNKLKKAVMLLSVFVFTFLITSAVALADKDIDDAKKKRDQTQEELDNVEASIEELAAEKAGIDEEIEEVNCALVQVLAEIDVIKQKLDDKQAQIDEAAALYNDAVETEKAQYEAMKLRIKYLYENGDQDLLSIFIETGDINEALTRAEYVDALYKYDRNMLTTYQETVAKVNELHENLLAEQAELELLQEDYAKEQEYMEGVMLELQAVADDYGGRIASAKAQAAAYAKQIKAQNREIARLEEEARKKAEEERKRKEEEARRKAAAQVADAQNTGVIKTTNSVSYDVSSIYSAAGGDTGKAVAAYACKFIGNPYVAGGTSLTDGADCSGFVFAVYRDFGYKVPRTSYALRSAGTEVSLDQAQPGDVVCYPGHVGIYIGNGMIVHASTERTGIKVSRADYRSIASIRRLL